MRKHLLTVAGGMAAALAVWAISVPVLDIHLTARFGGGAIQHIGVGSVIAATLLASLAGWGALAGLERRTPRAHTIWAATAVVVALASLSLPLLAGTTASSVAALIAMHLSVAAVLIPSLLATRSVTRSEGGRLRGAAGCQVRREVPSGDLGR